MTDLELQVLENDLREHVNALAVDIGPRTPSSPDSLVRAGNYIHSVFENAGFSVSEQNYEYYDQRVTNVLATLPATAGASAYYVVGAHYDTVPNTPGADDNASAVAVMLELARLVRQAGLQAPVLFAAFTLEELSFPKITSGRIDDAVQPGSEWRQWHQIVGRLDARAHLSVMPSACALDCNTPHMQKALAAGAPRRR